MATYENAGESRESLRRIATKDAERIKRRKAEINEELRDLANVRNPVERRLRELDLREELDAIQTSAGALHEAIGRSFRED